MFSITIEILKRTGCDYFNFNIQIGVPQVQLIVYSDGGLLESQFCSRMVQETKSSVQKSVNYVWNIVYIGGSELKLVKFFGFLKFKYKNSGVSLGWIPGLG